MPIFWEASFWDAPTYDSYLPACWPNLDEHQKGPADCAQLVYISCCILHCDAHRHMRKHTSAFLTLQCQFATQFLMLMILAPL